MSIRLRLTLDIPLQADKLQTLIKSANVDIEAIWPQLFAKALEGKDVKELLTNVGTGGAAAAAPAAGAAAGGAAPAEAKAEEKKEEGTSAYLRRTASTPDSHITNVCVSEIYREGGIRRGHGSGSVRLKRKTDAYTLVLYFLRKRNIPPLNPFQVFPLVTLLACCTR